MPTLLARLDAAQRRMHPAAFAVAVLRKSSDDQAGYLAVLLSFYAFLAVFPLLLVLATVLGIVLRDHPSVQQDVIHSALTDFPVIGTQLRANVHSLNGSVFGLTVGLIGTVWGARGLSICAQSACNTIWAIPFTRRPSLLHRQLRGLALLGVIAVDVLATGALSDLAGVGDGHALWLEWTGAAATTVVNAALFTLGFRLAIAREVRTHEFLPAACATAVVWQALLSLGSYLVDHELRHAEELYGTFGLVLGLLAWLHIQARVTVLLLEADCVRVRRLWPRTVDGPRLVPGDRRAFDAYAAMQQRRPGFRIRVEYGDEDDAATGQFGPAAEAASRNGVADGMAATNGTAAAVNGTSPARSARGGRKSGQRPSATGHVGGAATAGHPSASSSATGHVGGAATAAYPSASSATGHVGGAATAGHPSASSSATGHVGGAATAAYPSASSATGHVGGAATAAYPSASSATGEAAVSHRSAGTRSSTPSKSTPPGSVPKARP